MRKPIFGVSDQVRHDQAVQPQKMGRGLKFWSWIEEGFCYLCSENKGADQMWGYRAADLRLCFLICKIRFSHDPAQLILPRSLKGKAKLPTDDFIPKTVLQKSSLHGVSDTLR